MSWAEIKKAVNSNLTKPLNTLITERTDISTTGVGNTIFSTSTAMGTVTTGFALAAKFIPPVTGIYKCVINTNQARQNYQFFGLPTLSPVYYANTTTTNTGINSIADWYMQFAVGAEITTASLLNAYLHLVRNSVPALTGTETTTTLYLNCVRGVPCMVFVYSVNSAYQVTSRTITYGNS